MEADCGSMRSRSQEVVQREMSVVKKAALKDRASALQAAYVAEVKAAAAAEGKKVSLAVYTLEQHTDIAYARSRNNSQSSSPRTRARPSLPATLTSRVTVRS